MKNEKLIQAEGHDWLKKTVVAHFGLAVLILATMFFLSAGIDSEHVFSIK